MRLPHFLAMLAGAERTLAQAHRTVADGHAAESDVAFTCAAFARLCDTRADALTPARDRYASVGGPEPDRLHPPAAGPGRAGPIGLLRDLVELHQLATLVQTTWELVDLAAYGARDRDLISLAAESAPQLHTQLAWLTTRMKAEAAQGPPGRRLSRSTMWETGTRAGCTCDGTPKRVTFEGIIGRYSGGWNASAFALRTAPLVSAAWQSRCLPGDRGQPIGA